MKETNKLVVKFKTVDNVDNNVEKIKKNCKKKPMKQKKRSKTV